MVVYKILPLETSDIFLDKNTPEMRNYSNTAKNLIEKEIRYKSHVEFLDSCTNLHQIPTGFRMKWKLQMDADEEVQAKCDKIKEDAAFRLMNVTRDACMKKVKDLQGEINFYKGRLNCEESSIINEFSIGQTVKYRLNKLKKLQQLRSSPKTAYEKNNEQFKSVDIAKDGNCFYRCVSQFLYNTQMYHQSLREDLNQFMYRNSESYTHLIDGDIHLHLRAQSFADGRVTSWATEAELQAACDHFNININISRNRQHLEWEKFRSQEVISKRYNVQTLYVLLEQCHFSILQLKENKLSENVSLQTRHDWFDGMRLIAKDSDTSQTKVPDSTNTNNEMYRSDELARTDLKNAKGRKKTCNSKEEASEEKGTGDNNEMKTSVTNLSRYKLSAAEQSLLVKGLKFIPSRKHIDKVKLLADLSKWERRMRLREFFADNDDNIDETTKDEKFKVKRKSIFTPQPGRNASLDLYVELVKNDVVSSLKNTGQLNLESEEHDAFHALLHNDQIVIRPADKGSGIVIMDTDKYVESLKSEIESNASYQSTERDLSDVSYKNVKTLVNRMLRNGSITSDMHQYLIPRYPQAGRLKGNPKLHKENTPLRTIVSGIDTATEKLAELADHELQDFVESSPSYLRDTTDFIVKLGDIHDRLPDGDCFLFCFDLRKLYPSIPKIEGINACREALQHRKKPIVKSTDDMIEVIETVLDNNNFSLGNNHYKQVDGVAIGSRLGKNYACSYMRTWDEKLMAADKIPIFYKRFIDDGFGVWMGNEAELKSFAQHANSIHRNIQVDLRYSKHSIEFLDTNVRLENGRIYTDLYVKPTDRQLYIRKNSCHPPNTKRSLPYGLGLRLRRICERDQDYLKHRQNLKQQLRKRGYSGSFLEGQLKKVDTLKREDLLSETKKKKKHTERVPLVLTYSNLLPNVHEIVHKHLHVLYSSDRMTEVFKEPPLVAFRRDKNLCDTLVHSKTNRSFGTASHRCENSCTFCKILTEEDVSDTAESESYRTVQNINCRMRNLVYCIHCNRCKRVVYVGETERQARERMVEHLRDIRLRREVPIAAHFDGHHDENDLHFSVLEHLHSAGRHERLLHEALWIKRLSTVKPRGCNVKDTAVNAQLLKNDYRRYRRQ